MLEWRYNAHVLVRLTDYRSALCKELSAHLHRMARAVWVLHERALKLRNRNRLGRDACRELPLDLDAELAPLVVKVASVAEHVLDRAEPEREPHVHAPWTNECGIQSFGVVGREEE